MLVLRTARTDRTARASSLVETMALLSIAIPILFVVVTSVSLLIAAKNLNDKVCYAATRAASSGPPNAVAYGEPSKTACRVVRSLCPENKYISIHPDPLVLETLQKPFPAPPFGGPIDGDVTVITTVAVKLPIISQCGRTISWQTVTTLPYTWVMKPSIDVEGTGSNNQN